MLELRDAVAQRYRLDYGVEIKPEEVILTAGAKQALYNAAMVLFDPGDEVITHGPFWPSIGDQIKLADATPVVVQTHMEDGFTIKAASIIDAMTPRTKAIIINSPCNPTGALISESEMALLADAAAARGIWVIVDFTYEKLIYEPVPHNLIKVLFERMRDKTVICSAASKAYAMTGWRCGWAVGPKEIDRAVQRRPGPLDVEHQLDHTEGRDRRVDRTAGRRDGDAQRVPQTPRRGARLADRRSAFRVREARRRILFVPVHRGAPVADGIRSSGEFAEALLKEVSGRRHAGRRLRRARILPPVVRDVDRAIEGRLRSHQGVRAEARINREAHRRALDGLAAGPARRRVQYSTRSTFFQWTVYSHLYFR